MFCSLSCRNKTIKKFKAPAERVGKTCPKCGHYAYRRTTELCNRCGGSAARVTVSTPERMDYVRSHYPTDGAQSVAEALGLTVQQVRMMAQKAGVALTPSAYRRIVHAKAAEHMATHNPMHNEQSLSKMLDYWERHPEQNNQRAEAFLKGKQKDQRKHPSKPEKKARAILKRIGVEFEQHALIKPNFIVDLRLGTLIIQIDGEYWHGHPRYTPLTDRQKAQRKRDAAQDKYLSKCGYTVVRVWERDVTESHLRAVLSLHGLL